LRSSRHTLFTSFCSAPPPLRTTLFPYTTLFRSPARARLARLVLLVQVDVRLLLHDHRPAAAHEALAVVLEAVGAQRRVGDHDHVDRKSTRLNSSLQIISYAVFCLKKKNNKDTKY